MGRFTVYNNARSYYEWSGFLSFLLCFPFARRCLLPYLLAISAASFLPEQWNIQTAEDACEYQEGKEQNLNRNSITRKKIQTDTLPPFNPFHFTAHEALNHHPSPTPKPPKTSSHLPPQSPFPLPTSYSPQTPTPTPHSFCLAWHTPPAVL